MEIIIQLICALIGGGFTLFGAWYAHHLQKDPSYHSTPQGLMSNNIETAKAIDAPQKNKFLVIKDTGFMLLVVNISLALSSSVIDYALKGSVTISDPTIDLKIVSISGFVALIITTIVLTIICLKTKYKKITHLFKVVTLYALISSIIDMYSGAYSEDTSSVTFATVVLSYFILLLIIPISFSLSYFFSWVK